MKKKDIESSSTEASIDSSNLTLEKLVEAYKLLPPPIDVWKELVKKHNINPDLGDLLILSTKDQDKLSEWGLEIPTWVKFSLYVDEGEMIVVRAPAIFK